LKKKIGNKARVEGSICNAYLNEEVANFCSLYFDQHVETKASKLTVGVPDELDSDIPELFRSLGEGSTIKGSRKWLSTKEYDLAHLYVLSNIEILREYEE
jgi:Domain of unknown function (DUF4218)